MSVKSKKVTLKPSGNRGIRISVDEDTAATLLDLARWVAGPAKGTYKNQVYTFIQSLKKVGVPMLSHASSRFTENSFGGVKGKATAAAGTASR